MGRYEDAYQIAHAQERFAESLARGSLQNLGEMEFFAEHKNKGTEAYPYPTLLKEGHVDGNIHLPDRYQTARVGHRRKKKVFWKFEEGMYLPFFREQDTNHLVPAAILHFPGGSNRLTHRFDPLHWNNCRYSLIPSVCLVFTLSLTGLFTRCPDL